MPTTYTDQFFDMDPANPPAAGTTLTVQVYDLVDQNDDGDIDRFNNDTVNGVDVTRSWPGDTITINVPGQGNVIYVGTTFYLADGTRVFTPTDGKVLQEGTLVSTTFVTTQGPLDVDTLGPPCFTPGTMIETPDGPRRVEDLQPGDMITTVDHGAQPLLWVGKTRVEARGKLAPIRFEAGILGLDRPLMVSPQHRMLVSDWRAPYHFGHSEVLIAAHCLVNDDTVTRVESDEIEYIHLLFSRHEIVIANGAKSESYYPGHAVTQADRDTQAEVLRLFPELRDRNPVMPETARPVVRPREARALAI
ncbi:Hint domain-containing protein [Ruegeria arenilitoris]|uniref:Hint domain-containing protein n=1 Tax=Ruegeria arenilitoris TaxID=1173585 RepID=UPI001479A6EA|nr:Hint domain-containing protein [Ruegeria arenilitoris]